MDKKALIVCKIFIPIFLILTGFVNSSKAQTRVITGRVTNGKSESLSNVTVHLKGKNTVSTTNETGDYSITVPVSKATLIFRRVGFEVREIALDDNVLLNVELVEIIKELDDVVVVGYGTSRKSELTESVSRVKNDELKRSTGASIESAMQGRLSGVKVTTNEGGPGSGLKVSVRGTSSINGSNEPLYVIDGVPMQKDVATGSSGGVYSSLPSDPMSGINPNDIESIEVLKDASATAIYGSRGANGVVLITTKQGKAGKLAINYESSYGVENLSNKLDLLNGREYYKYQYLRNPSDSLFINKKNPNYIDPTKLDEAPLGVDWQDEVYRQAFIQNQQLNFRGGTEKTSFYASLGYLNQQGIVVANDFKRYTGLLNLNVKADKFKLTGSMNFSQSDKTGSVYASGGPNNDFAGVVTKVFFARPIGDKNVQDSEFALFDQDLGLQEDFITNPYLFATLVTNENNQSKITTNINTFYEFAKNFEMQVRLGGNLTFDETNRYFPSTTAAGKRLNGYAQILRTDAKQFSFEHLIHYRNSWGKHHLKAMAGYTLEKGNRNVLSVENQGFAYNNNGVNDIGLGTDLLAPNNAIIDFSLNSYLGRFNYNYLDKYYLTFTGRVDGSSKFPTSNKYAFFPSGSFAWNVHKEKFLENSKWINNFRVRYSLGSTGNQAIPSYESLALMNNNTYSFGGGLQTGLVFSQLSNPKLRWETTNQHNLGFDLGFLNSRINLSVDGFIKRTNDVLLAIPVSSVIGVDSPYQNAGAIENKGLEFSLSTKNVNKKKFNWTTDFNISFYKNKIISLGGIEEFYADFGGGEFSNLMIYRKGGEIGEFYGYKTDGIYKTQEDIDKSPKNLNAKIGSWKFKDINGDSIINTLDRTVIGSNQPKYFGGITNTLQVYNFDVSFFLSFSVGQQVYNANRYVLENSNDSRNKLKSYLDNAFRASTVGSDGKITDIGNPNGTLPAIGTTQFNSPIDEYVEDASFLRLQNVTIGYTIPFANKLKISRLRLFVSGNNLLLFTKYKGYDPDVNTTRNNGLIKGVDFGSYPRSTNLMGGINVSF